MMDSTQVVRERALRRGPGFWGFWLAHHTGKDLERCYQRWAGRRPIWICARCLGLWPVLLVLTGWQLVAPLGPGWWDAPWLFLPALPAAVEWTGERLGCWRSANRWRTLTGAALGLSLGRLVALNMVRPGHPLVIALVGVLAVGWAVVEVLARYRTTRGGG